MKKLIFLISILFIYSNNLFSQAVVGDFHQGGVVFWVDPNDNTQGMVCDINDLDTFGIGVEWGCYGSFINGADGAIAGSGEQNTIDIINGCNSNNIAAAFCANSNAQGYNDWFLPGEEAMFWISMNRSIIDNVAIANGGSAFAGLGQGDYWTSTEHNEFYAKYQDVQMVMISNGFKNANRHVRAVRKANLITSASWDCDPVIGCFDPSNGQGVFTTLLDCQNNCLPQASSFITGNDTICYNQNIDAEIMFSFSGQAPFTFTYNINGVTQPLPITTSINPYTLFTQQEGIYTINSFNDAIGTGTVSGAASVTVNTDPVDCPSLSIFIDNTRNKKILKITNLLGRETQNTNQTLFYLYDDGTVEKRIIID
tara:strand:- start:1262 stop:2365 length:1104 start_codon:yes stop_codon:yes gene_type:complete